MTVYIKALGAKGERWQQQYGTDTLPIVSPHPTMETVNGQPGVPTFELSLEDLTPEERRALTQDIALAKGLTPVAVEHLLETQGLAITVDPTDELQYAIWDVPNPRGIEYAFKLTGQA